MEIECQTEDINKSSWPPGVHSQEGKHNPEYQTGYSHESRNHSRYFQQRGFEMKKIVYMGVGRAGKPSMKL